MIERNGMESWPGMIQKLCWKSVEYIRYLLDDSWKLHGRYLGVVKLITGVKIKAQDIHL